MSGGRVDANRALDVFADVVQDRFAQIFAFQDAAAFAVDQFALPVHHVVVIQNVLARLEIVFLDLLLRPLDHAGQQFGVHRQMLVPRPQQGVVGAVAEQPPQFVFQADEEAAFARIALPSRAPAQLVVNAAAFVALRAQNEQTAQTPHLVAPPFYAPRRSARPS